jgi:hypothetical protein
VDVNSFLTFRLRRMNFSIGFSALGLRNMNYLCIELSLSGTDRSVVTIEY